MNKSILDVINSPEIKAELMRIQTEMYEQGRVDCMKNTIHVLEMMNPDLFTKDNVMGLLKGVLILTETMARKE